MNNNLEKQIEAILFWKGEPMQLKKLAEFLKVSKEEVAEAVNNLKNNLAERGVVLQELDGEVTLGTAPQFSSLIENLRKEELSRELSKASLETLSIILYKNGAGRALIDYIRGVNSSFTLRALSIRGLIEKTTDPKDNRRYVYKPSFELLSYMGVTKVEELPEFEEVNKGMETSEQELEKEISAEENPEA